MNKKKLILLALVAVMAFTMGYGIVAKAWPTPYWRGYFWGGYDDPGEAVLPAWGGDTSNCYANGLALPTWVDSADEFINFIYCKLYMTDHRSHIGAAFIVSTMTGMKNAYPGATEFNEFASRVRYADSQGWVNWHAPFSCITPNTYSQNDGTRDVAAYGDCDTSSEMVRFSRDGNPNNSYIIKRLCANPMGDFVNPLPSSWSVSGASTVTDGVSDTGDTPTNITTRPGDTLSFVNRITNNGPTQSYNWYALYGHPNAGNFTGQYYNNTTLSGTPAMTRSDPGDLKFDWGGGSPGGGLGADYFSVRWSKTEHFSAGNYIFAVVADDGVRVYVDGNLIIDRWILQGPTHYSAPATLSEGNHTIVIEYYENAGGAVAYAWHAMEVQGGIEAGFTVPGDSKTYTQNVPVPAGAAPGTKICRRILWDRKNSWSAGDFAPYYGTWGMSGAACATVAANFSLVPTIDIQTSNGTRVVQQGDTVTFRYLVDNTATSGTSASATCTITGSQPAGTPAPPATNCPRTFAGPGGAVEVTNSPQVITIGNQSAGSTICRTLTVSPATYGGGSANSGSQCVVVAKTPYVHFFGGDVWAGGGFAQADGTCTTNPSAKITTVSNVGSGAGSMVEYGAFALSDITRFGSGSKPLYNSSDFADLGRRLSFANNTVNIGRFGAPQHCVNDYSSEYASLPLSTPPGINNPVSGAWRVTGPINLAGTMPLGDQPGGRKVYYVEGDVNLNGRIAYPSSYTSAAQIPSLVIIATGNIRVLDTVDQVDGVFISRGTFFTCHPKPSPPTTTTCAVPLTVNGSVIARELDLYRTRGGDGATSELRQLPAEVFNLSPEVFLNNVLNTNSSQSITISESRELPPRF